MPRRPARILLAVVVACALFLVGAPRAVAATPVPPANDAFYQYPGSLAAVSPGTVLKQRSVSLAIAGLSLPVTATQLLYRTTSQLGAPAASVTTVIAPVVATGARRLVSFDFAYDALSSECDPSYVLQGGGTALQGYFQAEFTSLTPLLLAGDTIVASDYEGPDLAFGIGQQEGYNTLDGLRAAEHYLAAPAATTPAAMIGYSGGSIGTQWAAEMAPAYAPELHLVGAALGGNPVDYAHNLTYINGTTGVPDWPGVIPALLDAASESFQIDLTPYLSAYGEQVLHAVSGLCIAQYLESYPGLTYQQLVKPQYADVFAIPVFARIVNTLIEGTDGTPRIPLYMGVGTLITNAGYTGDGVMIAADMEGLAHEYCQRGVPVQFATYAGAEHLIGDGMFATAAVPYLQNLLDGGTATDGCASIGTGNALTPLPIAATTTAPSTTVAASTGASAGAAATGASAGTTASVATGAVGQLPQTGTDLRTPLAAGVALVVLGVDVLAISRRRRRLR